MTSEMHQHMHANTALCQVGDKAAPSAVAAGPCNSAAFVQVVEMLRQRGCAKTAPGMLLRGEQRNAHTLIANSKQELMSDHRLCGLIESVFNIFNIMSARLDKLESTSLH